MEKARDNSSMGLGKSQQQKVGYSGSTKRQKESPLCHIDGHLSPQKCGVRTKATEVLRQTGALEYIFKRGLWSLCSLH